MLRGLLSALVCLLIALAGTTFARDAVSVIESVALEELPPQARQTLKLIKLGGPFPHRRDGVAFGNYEKRLPLKPRGYYHEYTVPTPGARNRGARRIVTGSADEYYYSGDHYQTFRRIRE